MAADPAGIAGVVLAGGRARRFGGGDKGLRRLAGRPLLDHVIGRVRPQVAALALNANGDPRRFAGFGLPVVSDAIGDPDGAGAGPLAGILAGLDWAAAAGCGRLLSVPCDAPFLPPDLASRLHAAGAGADAEAAVAVSAGREHPVVALWSLSLRARLRAAVADRGVRAVRAWLAELRAVRVDFPVGAVDPFLNVNTPQALAEAERSLPGKGGEGGSDAT